MRTLKRLDGMKWILAVSLEKTATNLTLNNFDMEDEPYEAMKLVGELNMLSYLISRYIEVLTSWDEA